MRRAIAFLAALAALGAAQAVPTDPVPTDPVPTDPVPTDPVRIDSGSVAGSLQGAIRAYKGIPYAAPPVGALRWRPPQPALHWPGTRNAALPGPACPQMGPPGRDILKIGGAPEPTSEDCLTLNIWTPGAAKKAPVMVWIHGGSGRFGSGSLPYYDGTSFARDGIVLVTINYRLGNLGGFAHPALTRSAPKDEPLVQYAVMDQIAALEWVRRNIAAFGGDPHNVTLFGESAGALSTLVLMTSERASGLFNKAIVESGGGWFPPSTLADAEKCGVEVASKLGLPGAQATPAQLRALSVKQLNDVGQVCSAMVDDRLFRDQTTIAFAAGRAADIPLIIGVNSGEDSLLDMTGGIEKAKASLLTGEQGKSARELYGPAMDDETLVRSMFRDSLLVAPARWLAALSWRAQPTYLYYFDYVDEAQRPVRQRAPHGSDVFHVFETFDARPDGEPPATRADRAMGALMHACWVGFAKTGHPVCTGADTWPPYTRDADSWMVFNARGAHVEPIPNASRLDKIEGRIRWALWLGRIKAALDRWF
ncbi:MAG TPA: carboxylesterase family protein [Steroidobacteraceae bacterium]|nr:carboxylesterase family protein [Steroidobacteraceae bacterium]